MPKVFESQYLARLIATAVAAYSRDCKPNVWHGWSDAQRHCNHCFGAGNFWYVDLRYYEAGRDFR